MLIGSAALRGVNVYIMLRERIKIDKGEQMGSRARIAI